MKKLVPLLLPLLFLACGKESLSPPSPLLSEISLNALAPAGCLDLPTYREQLRRVDRGLPARAYTTHFSLEPKSRVREKFRLLLAFSTFRFGERSLDAFHDFSGFTQQGCESLTYRTVDGSEHIFSIKNSGADHLYAESEDGRSLRATWLGPRSLEVEAAYPAYDLPCSDGKPASVRVTHRLDWNVSAAPPPIDPAYLGLVAEAVGTGDLTENGLPSPSRIREALAKGPRPELLLCD